MSSSLTETINNVLINSFSSTTHELRDGDKNNINRRNNCLKYIKIPLSEDIIELPLFLNNAFNDFPANFLENSISEVLVELTPSMDRYYGKTLGTQVKHILYTPLFLGIQKIKIDTDEVYYGSYGTIFNEDFEPIVMFSWKLGKQKDSNNYRLIRPILRINGKYMLNKADPMQKYIVNKILPEAASLEGIYGTDGFKLFLDNYDGHCRVSNPKLKIEIDECPFPIIQSKMPDINTTQEELRNTLYENFKNVLL